MPERETDRQRLRNKSISGFSSRKAIKEVSSMQIEAIPSVATSEIYPGTI